MRADKSREADDGFDGAWVAHPDSVPSAMEEFDKVLGDRPNQVDRQRDDVHVTAEQLLDAQSAGGDEITEEGLHMNCNVGIQYISSWLRGNGAAGIYGLMEDAATAEISRSQVWQWVHHGMTLDKVRAGRETEQLEKIRDEVGADWFDEHGRADQSRRLFESVALDDEFAEFLTLPRTRSWRGSAARRSEPGGVPRSERARGAERRPPPRSPLATAAGVEPEARDHDVHVVRVRAGRDPLARPGHTPADEAAGVERGVQPAEPRST